MGMAECGQLGSPGCRIVTDGAVVCTLEALAEPRSQIACRKADARTQAHLVLGRHGPP